ncbi:pyrimidine/purine nucleoside phosphorylase [Photobacterium minamisatsumaniensis]|uniref:pyrimidine/purine nucleoside phosphorylase n=1 Tax=Photobacterium minamisatsumaniensis TaxID=2910233 RepID=UPI003D119F13
MFNETYNYQDSYVFFDGNVILRNFKTDNNELITFGFMRCGEYRWLADEQETFHIESGQAVFLVDDDEVTVISHSTFVVPKGKEFTVRVLEHLDYRCQYG